MSYKGVVKSVFSNRNVLVVSITSTMWSFTDMGWRFVWGLWLIHDLGATIAIVGMLSMIRNSTPLLFNLPGGILADRIGRKKILIYGTAIRVGPPLLYLLAGSWEWVIPAMILDAVCSIYNPAMNAIIADSLPRNQRGAGYGAYNTITRMPSVFMPAIGGMVMDALGYKQGVRIFLIAELVTSVAIFLVRLKYVTETLDRKKVQRVGENRGLKARVSSAFDIPKTIKIMAVVSTVSSFAMNLVMQFMSVYAHDVVMLSNTQIGLVTTVNSVLAMVLSLPGGLLSDRFGRKPLIVSTMLTTPISTWAVTLVSIGDPSFSFLQYLMIQLINGIIVGLGGGGGYGMTGGSAWQALVADVVPIEKRGTVNGILGTITGILSSPSSWLGGYIWATYTPQTPYQYELFFGLLAPLLFAIFVKEPKKEEELSGSQ